MPSKRKISTFLTTRTAKLAGTYLAIIMLMSVSFSVIFYNSTTRPLNRPAPSSDVVSPFGQRAFLDSQVQQVIEERFAEARQELTLRLVWINLSILVLGAGVSYVLARLSLSPIEEAMEAQSQFISDASHELRTPLTVLQSTNEVALRRKKLTLTDARDLIEYNLAETKKMKELSNTLLELLKDDSKEATFSKVNLQDVTSEALQSIVSYAQSRDISINDNLIGKIVIELRNDIVPRARGEAAQMIAEAEAFESQVVNRAKGDADRFVSVYNSYKSDPDVTSSRIYLETMEKVLSNVNKIIMDKSSSNSGIVPYLPIDKFQSKGSK